jgi:hypothetical protein
MYGIDNIEYGMLPEVAEIPGDFNEDNLVDAADFVVWKKVSAAENDLSRVVADADEYGVWQTNYGESADRAVTGRSEEFAVSAAALAGVPEPSAGLLLLLGALPLCGVSRGLLTARR